MSSFSKLISLIKKPEKYPPYTAPSEEAQSKLFDEALEEILLALNKMPKERQCYTVLGVALALRIIACCEEPDPITECDKKMADAREEVSHHLTKYRNGLFVTYRGKQSL